MWWHVIGATVVVLILIFGVPHHASLSYVFTDRQNITGFFGGETTGAGFWFFVVPLSFILTQYTITGYDASAHLSEETPQRGRRRGQGHLAVDLLLGDRRLDPAAGVPVRGAGARTRVNKAAVDGFAVTGIFATGAVPRGVQGRDADLDDRASSTARRRA